MSEDPKFATGLRPYHHFFLEYGQFFAAFNNFEVAIEIALMRLLRLSVRETSTVFASVGFAAKQNILGALLSDTPDGASKYRLITDAISLAERNGFAHGMVCMSEDEKLFTIIRREVKGSHKVTPKGYYPLQMQRHLHVFVNKTSEVQDALGISDDDLIRYQREIESLAKAPEARSAPRPPKATSFSSSTKQLRRERKAQRKALRQKGNS
jgi:hypothetical protein